jgi:hypothetical protein
MKLQRREKMLLGVMGGVVAMMVCYFLFVAGDSRPVEQLVKDRDKIKAEVAKKRNTQKEANDNIVQLEAWRRRAVPSEQAIYNDWLRNLAAQFISKPFKLESQGSEQQHGGVYTKFSFKLSGHASVAKLTEFLYEFYKAGHLHQIKQMELKPAQNTREPELDVALTVEALSLAGVERKELSTEPGPMVQQGKKMADYKQPVTKRDLFIPFVPRNSTSGPDMAQFAFITGITEANGKKLVWLQDRMAGKMMKLAEGEKFQVGEYRGTVLTITPLSDEVVVDFDGKRRRIRDGENLRGGVQVRD